MLIPNLLNLVFQRGNISFQRLRCSSVVRHSSHYSRSFDCSSYRFLISISQIVAVSAFNVTIASDKLSQKLNVSPMNIVFIDLFQILLSFFIAVQRLEKMAKWLRRLQFIIGFLNCKIVGSVIRLWIEFSFSQIFKLMQQVGSAFCVDDVLPSNSSQRWIRTDILSQSDVHDVFNSKSIIIFEVNLSGFKIILQKLEERIEFQRDTFLYRVSGTCDLDIKIYSLDSPVFSSQFILLVIYWLIQL